MELAQWLLALATRHEKAKDKYEEELTDWQMSKRHMRRQGKKIPARNFVDNEILLHEDVVSEYGNLPACFADLSVCAILALAYFFKATMSGDNHVMGHEVIGNLQHDLEHTLTYLNALEELRQKRWLNLYIEMDAGLLDEPPFCWYQAVLELGEVSLENISGARKHLLGFESNDAFLDAIFAYLEIVSDNEHLQNRMQPKDSDFHLKKPEGTLRRIYRQAEHTKIELPAIEVKEKYKLSLYQHLCLMGMFGHAEKDISFDFNDADDVTRLFAKQRSTRIKMRKHLYDTKSPLLKQKLIEGFKGDFGEGFRITAEGIKALTGQKDRPKSKEDIKQLIKKTTLFDMEEPKLRRDCLHLPTSIHDAVRTILFSESREGILNRKAWYKSLPSAWGTPSGTTILLYGPPGTGKTLTAQYLASELKRPLLKVDAAKILSCWVGESEQHVRRIFDDYTMLQKELKSSPVLLMNEADQLLGARGSAERAVDKMYNNMQNLFLEGIERFSGILIATTNRQDLLDSAFSRRFTYKLVLPNPDRTLRKKFWESHLPKGKFATAVELEKLAELNLTGGEIRLVVEKAVRLAAYRGSKRLDDDMLMQLAVEELSARQGQSGTMRRIGFVHS